MQLKSQRERQFLILEYDNVTWNPRVEHEIFQNIQMGSHYSMFGTNNR